MDFIAHVLFDIGPYHWLALAALLIAVEMVMPTQYLMWPGIAAAIVGLLSLLVDLPLLGEVGIFAVLSAALAVASHRLFPETQLAPAGGLNQRTDQMVGRRAVVSEAFENGRGAVTVGDTRWEAEAADGLAHAVGSPVEIVGAVGTLLRVRRS